MKEYFHPEWKAVRDADTECEIAERICNTECPKARRGSALEDVEKVVRHSGRHIAFWSPLIDNWVFAAQGDCPVCG